MRAGERKERRLAEQGGDQRTGGFQARRERADSSDLEKVQHFFDYEFMGRARGVALFTSAAHDFWRLYELKVPVHDFVFVGDSPYVLPLLSLVDDLPRYCVVLVDEQKARIFGFRLGELEELGELTNEFLHGKQKQGGWAQARIQRHHEWGVRQHLKAMSKKLLALFERHAFDMLLVGRPSSEIEPWFMDELYPLLQERDVLDRLKDSLGPTKMGVTGLDDTLFLVMHWIRAYAKQVITATFTEDVPTLTRGLHQSYPSGERAAKVLAGMVQYQEYLAKEGIRNEDDFDRFAFTLCEEQAPSAPVVEARKVGV